MLRKPIAYSPAAARPVPSDPRIAPDRIPASAPAIYFLFSLKKQAVAIFFLKKPTKWTVFIC